MALAELRKQIPQRDSHLNLQSAQMLLSFADDLGRHANALCSAYSTKALMKRRRATLLEGRGRRIDEMGR
jgi:hypothetical protein